MFFYHRMPEKFMLDVHEYPVLHGIENGKFVWKDMTNVLSDIGIYNAWSFLFLDMDEYFDEYIIFDEDIKEEECSLWEEYLIRRKHGREN